MRKNIKNYTTETKPERAVAQIEELVVKRVNARQFFKEYDSGEIVSVVFIIPTDKGDLPFKMPARWKNVLRILYGQRSGYTQGQIDQAKRTAWCNVRDWIDSQVALIETEQVKVQEVFLPYMVNQSGQTLFEIMEKTNYKMPQLGSGAEEGEVIP